MELVVLGLLMMKNLTLYDLRKSFERGISLFYSASFGSIQFALKKLLKDGAITVASAVAGGRYKKTYAITSKGRAAFLAWMHSADIPESKLDTIALTKLYFLGLLPGREDRKIVLGTITNRVAESYHALSAMNAALNAQVHVEEVDSPTYYQLRSLDYGVTMMRHSLAWYEKELARLQSAS